MKTQNIRLIDVFAIGPFLFYASNKTNNQLIKSGLQIIGGATILYNLNNYYRKESGE